MSKNKLNPARWLDRQAKLKEEERLASFWERMAEKPVDNSPSETQEEYLKHETIEDEIWSEFTQLSGFDYHRGRNYREVNEILNGEWGQSVGTIGRIDQPQFIWSTSSQVHSDELIEKVLRGENKWDQVVDDLPKRVVTEYHEPEFRKLHKRLLSIFHTSEDALHYIKFKRFKDGVICAHCGCTKTYVVSNGMQYKCADCFYKFSATTKTIFHCTKLPLTHWMSALVILTSKNKISSPKLAEILHVTQKTAYWMGRKIKENINDPFLRELNHGIFEYKPPK